LKKKVKMEILNSIFFMGNKVQWKLR